jgi:hypothetical protein
LIGWFDEKQHISNDFGKKGLSRHLFWKSLSKTIKLLFIKTYQADECRNMSFKAKSTTETRTQRPLREAPKKIMNRKRWANH